MLSCSLIVDWFEYGIVLGQGVALQSSNHLSQDVIDVLPTVVGEDTVHERDLCWNSCVPLRHIAYSHLG